MTLALVPPLFLLASHHRITVVAQLNHYSIVLREEDSYCALFNIRFTKAYTLVYVPYSAPPDTLAFYQRKVGHLTRIFEHPKPKGEYQPFLLAKLDAARVDAYIEQRREEGVTDHTIKKELVTLQATLKLAKRRKLWRGDLDEVMPERFSPDYKPKERNLSVDELQRLLPQLTPDRAARVAFIVATTAEWGVTERAERADVDVARLLVFLRGTKRESRRRVVPIVLPNQQSLLRYAMEHAEGEDGMLFTPWSNARRDLLAACDAAGIAPCSFNDLRRTALTMLRSEGVPLDLIAPVAGHKTSRMLEEVYARLSPEALGRRVAAALGMDGWGESGAGPESGKGGGSNAGAAKVGCAYGDSPAQQQAAGAPVPASPNVCSTQGRAPGGHQLSGGFHENRAPIGNQSAVGLTENTGEFADANDTGTAQHCSAYAADSAALPGFAGLGGSTLSGASSGFSQYFQTLLAGQGRPGVPRDGIEPPTRGFSIPCSTD